MPPRPKPTPETGSTAVAARPTGQGRKLARRTITTEYVAALKAYSEVLYHGGLTPKGAKRPESVAALIEIGRDVGLPDTMAVAWIAVINGRPSIWGDAAMALIRASGLLESVREWYEGEPGTEGYTACFELKRVGDAEPRVTRFSVADAIRANLWNKPGPWTEYPDRQMMWRAKSWGSRDTFPDVMCGLVFVEEARDIPRVVAAQDAAEDAEPVKPTTPPAVNLARGPVPTVPVQEPDPAPQLPAGPTPAEQESAESVSVPIAAGQLEEIGRLADLFFAGRGILDATADEARQQWAEFVFVNSAPRSVRSVKHLTAPEADRFIVTIGEQLDPFTYPRKSSGG